MFLLISDRDLAAIWFSTVLHFLSPYLYTDGAKDTQRFTHKEYA